MQNTLERALSLIMGEEISVTGAGRTDAGVHAQFFCAHFDSQTEDIDKIKSLIFRVNRYLPKDISVYSVKQVVPDAHARFSAISRTYQYFITRVKDPFREDSSWFLYGDLDIAAMNDSCLTLLNHTDFTSFSKLHSDVRTNNCRVLSANWHQEGSLLVFTITADRFLRNMVRAIVGTMIEIGKSRINLSHFEQIILSKDRCKAGQSAPAKGLFLTGIEYPDEIFIAK